MKRYNALHAEDHYECLEGRWVRHQDVERYIEDNFTLIEGNRKLGKENQRLRKILKMVDKMARNLVVNAKEEVGK